MLDEAGRERRLTSTQTLYSLAAAVILRAKRSRVRKTFEPIWPRVRFHPPKPEEGGRRRRGLSNAESRSQRGEASRFRTRRSLTFPGARLNSAVCVFQTYRTPTA